MLATGITGQISRMVEEGDTAQVMKSGTLRVFATPAMCALIEETAWKSVASELEEGAATVGSSLNIRHLSATPVGMSVTCKTTLVEIDGRRLVFSVTVEDEAGKVGEGIHERYVIRSDSFQKKAESKLEKK